MDKETQHDLVPHANRTVDAFSAGLSEFLQGIGLPSADVLASGDERRTVFQNLPGLVGQLSPTQRTDAMYVSKFVAACGAGLFDAALNYIWDEVVVRLRQRVARFDLGYFFDTAIRDAESRKQFRTEDDLARVSDADLIHGSLKCGFLSALAYKHLDYIRDMRNWASAAHPNSAQLDGLQLASWCQTCVKEVILKEPDGGVLEVGRLLTNLREQAIQQSDIRPIVEKVRHLPDDLVAALLRSLVGLYCDPTQEVRVRDNVRLVAPGVWGQAPAAAKGDAGLRYASYAANADVERKRLAHEFLELVDGLTSLPESDRALEIATLVQQLDQTHDAMNNFYNEPGVARQLRKFIGADGRIPNQVNEEYVRVLIRCRIGRRCGVAINAVQVYDELIDLFEEPQTRAFVDVLCRPEVAERLDNRECASRFREVAQKLLTKTVDRPLRQLLEAAIETTDAQLPKLARTSAFKKLLDASILS